MNAPADSRCYRHADRESYIGCQRCGRAICPDCMRDAAVGFQCPDCVNRGAKAVRAPRTIGGGRISSHEGIVTTVLIATNVGVYLITGIGGSNLVKAAGIMVGVDVSGDGVVFPGMDSGGYWRLLTSAFLHGSLLHLAFNMYALYLFGRFAEGLLGTARYIVFYLAVAVFSGAFVYALTPPTTQTLGASGAVFALLGFALVVLLKQGQDVRTLVVLIAINAVISLSPGISWQGHLGGFIAGLVLGAAVAYAPREARDRWQVIGLAAVLVATVGLVALGAASP